MRRPRWAAVALLGASFATGTLAGAGAMAIAERHRRPDAHHARGPDRYLEALTGTLHLTPQQRDSVRAVLDRHAPAMDSVWRQVEPRFARLRDAIRLEIRGHLTAGQQEAYTDMLQRHDAERHGQRPPGVRLRGED